MLKKITRVRKKHEKVRSWEKFKKVRKLERQEKFLKMLEKEQVNVGQKKVRKF